MDDFGYIKPAELFQCAAPGGEVWVWVLGGELEPFLGDFSAFMETLLAILLFSFIVKSWVEYGKPLGWGGAVSKPDKQP